MEVSSNLTEPVIPEEIQMIILYTVAFVKLEFAMIGIYL